MNTETYSRLLADLDRIELNDNFHRSPEYQKIINTVKNILIENKPLVSRKLAIYKLMRILGDISLLYGIRLVYNERRNMCYLHADNAPCAYNDEYTANVAGICKMTYVRSISTLDFINNIYSAMNEFKADFIDKYKDVPVFADAIESLNNKQ